MLSFGGLVALSFVCSTSGFTVTAPLSSSSSSTRPCHTSSSCTHAWHERLGSATTWPGRRVRVGYADRWVSPSVIPSGGRPAKACLAATSGGIGEQEKATVEAATAAAPRLKRVRRRRKDADVIDTANEEGGVNSAVTTATPADGFVEPVVPAASVPVLQPDVAPPIVEEAMATEAAEEVGLVLPSRSSGGTKGTKVRVTDSADNIDITALASAASGAAGGAASAVSQAAQSAMGSAMSVLGQGEAEIPAEYSDYVSTFQGAKNKSGLGKSEGPDLADLGADIARFRAKEGTRSESLGESVKSGAKDLISNIITIDFFVVIAFMLWFIAGVVSTYGFKNTFLLDEFNESWTPIVQPALGLLMGGTIIGGVVSKLGESGDDDGNQR